MGRNDGLDALRRTPNPRNRFENLGSGRPLRDADFLFRKQPRVDDLLTIPAVRARRVANIDDFVVPNGFNIQFDDKGRAHAIMNPVQEERERALQQMDRQADRLDSQPDFCVEGCSWDCEHPRL